jgi:hypothetical protein
VRKTTVALLVGYLMAGMTVVWCGIVVGRLAELGFILE